MGGTFGGVASAAVIHAFGVPIRGLVPAAAGLILLGAVSAAAVLLEVGVLPAKWKPGVRRQVAEAIFIRRGLVRGSLQFGFELGTGVRTYLPSAVPLILAAALLVGGLTFAQAVATGFGFGLARGAIPVFRMTARDHGSWDRHVSAAAGRAWYSRAAVSVILPVMAVSLLI